MERLQRIDGREIIIGDKKKTIVVFNSNLPDWVEKNSIGVNLKNIHRGCQLGGIKELHIVGASGNAASESTPSIVGSNADGTAYAGKAGFADPSSTFETKKLGDVHQITLNINGMKEQFEEKERGNIRSADLWSPEMNTAVQRGIFERGREELFGNDDEKLATFMAVLVSIGISTIAAYETHGATIINWLESVLVSYSLLAATKSGFAVILQDMNEDYGIKPFTLERMASLYTIMQRDKLLGSQSLVKALPAEKN